MRASRSMLFALLLAALLGASAGCGLADYEKRMDEQRARLELYDEENKLLGAPLDKPRGKDPYGNDIKVPFDVFLRVPKRIARSFRGAEMMYHSASKQPLYRYAGRGDFNVFIAMAQVAAPTTKPAAGDAAPEEFRARVREALMEYISREYRMSVNPPDFADLKKDTRKATRDGQPRTLDFDATVFDDPRRQEPSRFFVFFLTQKFRQAAVIYQMPVQAAVATGLHEMDLSLKTLDLSMAATLRMAYQSRQ
ncbi:MAG: hypothetical protein L0Y71_07065 [Gemmataceae bacterium]|nr:hypothetical protein [Gemmataceae bacterium]